MTEFERFFGPAGEFQGRRELRHGIGRGEQPLAHRLAGERGGERFRQGADAEDGVGRDRRAADFRNAPRLQELRFSVPDDRDRKADEITGRERRVDERLEFVEPRVLRRVNGGGGDERNRRRRRLRGSGCEEGKTRRRRRQNQTHRC